MAEQRGWGAPFGVVLIALLVGPLIALQLFGREFVISAIDVAAVGIGGWGLVVAWRRRSARVDLALVAYAAMLLVIAIQVLVLPGAADIIGGSSRFVVPTLLVVGLSQLVDEPPVWRWRAWMTGFGVVLAVWVPVLVIGGLLDPSRQTFYDVKNAIDMPLGASNYVAAFLLISMAVAGVTAVYERRFRIPAGVIAVGLLFSLSRAAVGALVVAAVVVLVGSRIRGNGGRRAGARWRAVLAGVAVVAVAAGLVVVGRQIVLDPTESRIAGAVSPDVGDRVALYQRAWDGFAAQPVLGHGLNRFEDLSQGLEAPHVNAHNLELHALSTTGILGAVAYLGLWALLAVRLLRSRDGPQRTALMVALLGLFLHAQIEALAYTRAVEALLACFVVIAGTLPGAVGVRTWEFRRL